MEGTLYDLLLFLMKCGYTSLGMHLLQGEADTNILEELFTLAFLL